MKLISWTNKTEVTVVDALMGSGKTTFAIQYMNQASSEQKFLYVTPFLEEIKRVKKAIKHPRRLVEPSEKNRSKLHDLKCLLDRGESIITTHELFKKFDQDVLTLLRLEGYELIMDEVADLVETVKMSGADIKLLKSSGLITVDNRSKVSWIEPVYKGKFDSLKQLIQTDNVYLNNDTSFIWTFPIEIFQAFRKVYILTYLFDGQIQRCYFDMHKLSYSKRSIEIVDPNWHVSMVIEEGKLNYRVIPLYKVVEYKNPDLSKIKDLIEIVDDTKLNAIGEPINKHGHDALTFSKLERLRKGSPIAKRIENNIQNVVRNIYKVKTNDLMWTIPKSLREKKVIGKGTRTAFVSSNARATNNYRHRSMCLYLLNRFMNPSIKGFFSSKGVEVNEDLFALSELLQWVWRSRIRDQEKITLYVPSYRMRTLLKAWLDDGLPAC